jgi:hypothetical protein
MSSITNKMKSIPEFQGPIKVVDWNFSTSVNLINKVSSIK